jgi:hypothetical protein
LPFNYKHVVKNGILKSKNTDTTIVAIPYFFSDLSEAKID